MIDLRLHETPSGGYRWALDPGCDDGIELLGEAFDVGEAAPGGRSTACFRFRVVEAGTFAVRLHYHRPWETGEPPLKTFAVTISV